MMMKLYTLFTLIFIGFLISCTEEPPKNAEYKFKEFSIEVPTFMKSIEDRNNDVVAEFIVDSSLNNNYDIGASVYKDIFVYEKGERKTLKRYYELAADYILNYNLESGSMNSPEEFEISGNKAMIFEITGEYDYNGAIEKYFFLTGVIETSNSFYQITVWTPLELEEELKPIMKEIIFSFKSI